MPNLLQLTQRSIQTGQMTKREISAAEETYKIASSELKLTDAEVQMLKHDMAEVTTSFAQLGLMVVGLIPGWGEAADATSAAIDFATGHPIAGTISAFCACPIAGWLGDIPLLGIRIYRIGSSTLKCGKTMFVIAKNGKRAEKVFAWIGGKLIEASHQYKQFKVIQKNVFDPVTTNLYKCFTEIEKYLKTAVKDASVRMYGKQLEYGRHIIKM